MRRKKDNKRVLIPRNQMNAHQNQRNARKKKKKGSGKLLFLMILALVAFVIGAGIGISFTLDDSSEGAHWENVTEEMTNLSNNTDSIDYDVELDRVDYNDNETIAKLNLTTEPSY
ncbi:hypothetical protein TL18_03030 [Methanobrevibacter sp. YE315]|uniref:hypothetical protein n=1 Tax=Methanobrevibacter sp. YE315 TaxID=1609968 RepID=UPI000764D980|nr:hypothetical protein [Methanobrevibacter sp. YE315]AMD17085.1 hypothetical protein TL18_03030 [Methanobrevibacter sp. YE315]